MEGAPPTAKGLRTRQNILASSRRVFARDGYVDARMSDIAAEAKLSNGGLYRYFESKPDVFAALIADLHEELYRASGHTASSFERDPLGALREANAGYVAHYYENRDVMRAFIEAAAVHERFRSIAWNMRERHVKRFATAIKASHQITKVAGIDVRVAAEAMACLVEQCCYVWYAHEDTSMQKVSVEDAVAICTHAWSRTFFTPGEIEAP
jgi:AcrR family transcriptional regulator